MTPSDIARATAEQLVYEAVGPNAWSRYSEEEKEQSAALILSAAAKMVRETGVEQALNGLLDSPAALTSTSVDVLADEHERRKAARAALQSLRALTEHKP